MKDDKEEELQPEEDFQDQSSLVAHVVQQEEEIQQEEDFKGQSSL
jgi:hypothetical protein